MNKKTARIFMVIALVLLILTAVSVLIWYRGQILIIRTYCIPSDSTNRIRIAALADLHGELLGENQEKLVQRVESIEPDLIVYLGDMIEKSKPIESVNAVILLTEQLVEIAPIYYVDGNHEQDLYDNNPEIYMQLNNKLEDLGAVQIENEIVSFINKTDADSSVKLNKVQSQNSDDPSGTKINLCGISTHYHWDMGENTLLFDLNNMEGLNILLCHYPESIIWYDAFKTGALDVALCGHTHGGLIRLPFIGGMIAPEQSWWPKYDLGAYPVYSDTTWSDYGGGEGSEYLGTMIISGGLAGEHGIPRINNPREISVIEIGDCN